MPLESDLNQSSNIFEEKPLPKAVTSIFSKLDKKEKEILLSFIKENLQIINKPNLLEDLQKVLDHPESKIQQQIETPFGLLVQAESKNPDCKVYKISNNPNKNLIPLTKIFNNTFLWLSFDEITFDLTIWKSVLNETIHKHLEWEKLSENDLNFFEIFPFIFNSFEKNIEMNNLVESINKLKRSLTKEGIKHRQNTIQKELKKDSRARLLRLLVKIHVFINQKKL